MLKSNFTEDKIEAGVDEVGRGCLAGPVVAAAVVFPKGFKHKELDDSKKLSFKRREELAELIKEEALFWAISEVDNGEIDKINILNASILAMHKALNCLKKQPEFILVDGNKFKPYKEIPYQCFIKGDGKYLSIAAASILAKVYRDRLMVEMHDKYPHYGWNTNAGYPTIKHRKGIEKHGVTPLHRMSFKLLPDQLELFD